MKTRQIIPAEDLDNYISALKQLGNKIVLMQGCYDQAHIGHLRFFEKGKEHGDVLIVGIDSDDLTRKRKGPQRPIIPQNERMEMVLGLYPVDYVVLKELRDDVDYLARQIKPDVLVFSRSTKDFEDYEKIMTEKHKDLCKEIAWLDPQAETSTSAIITRTVRSHITEFIQDLFSVFEKHGMELKKNQDE